MKAANDSPKMTSYSSKIIIRRIIALMVLPVVFATVLFATMISFWREYQTNAQVVAELSDQVERLTASKELLNNEIHRGGESEISIGRLANDFLMAGTDAIVVADLQVRLQAMIVGLGMEVSSSGVLPRRVVSGQSYLGLSIQLRGELRNLQKVLVAIESEVPLLFVERLDIRVDDRALLSGNTSSGKLLAQIDVFGARRMDDRNSGADPR